MTIKFSRRECLTGVGGFVLNMLLSRFAWGETLALGTQKGQKEEENAWIIGGSNFHSIYDDTLLREKFFLFLKNIYSIYPPEKMHKLIQKIVNQENTDKGIYTLTQGQINDIKPITGDLTYALPALFRQTRIIGNQIAELLKDRHDINGYMEIGTKGGYVSFAKSLLNLGGDIVLLNTARAAYGLLDMFERRNLFKVGRFVPLNNYLPIATTHVATASLDVVCNPIGFHHSPPDYRDAFVRSIRRCLRDGGTLIVRDHDVDSKSMNHVVALAHDVFNLGMQYPWGHNQQEIRNFTRLDELTLYLEQFGFQRTGKTLYQEGDPTKNVLFSFVAV